jgi:hypothetical protein
VTISALLVVVVTFGGCRPDTDPVGSDDSSPDDSAWVDDSAPVDDSVPTDDSVPPDDSTVIVPGDDDGDGWSEEMGDCDDADDDVYPEAVEVSGDGTDQNCDGTEVADVAAIDSVGVRLFEEDFAFWRYAGAAVDFLPDVTGDDFDDVIIGAPVVQKEKWGGGGLGHAYLLNGPFESTLVPADSFAQIWSDEILDGGGQTASALGDLNGDGSSEIAFGAPLGLRNDGGYVAIYSAPMTGHLDLDDADGVLVGPLHGTLGDGVTGLGDSVWALTSNYDANLTVIVHEGLPSSEDPTVGARAILSGVPSAAANHLATGDLNGDGVSDLGVGAGGYQAGGSQPGAVYLLAGPLSGSLLLEEIGANWRGTWEDEHAGESLSVPGDVDSDGLDDIVVGAFFRAKLEPVGGGAFVVLGTSDLDGEHILDDDAHLRIETEHALDSLGDDVAGVGDLDGNGAPDIAISASRSFSSESPAPRIYFLLSPPPSGVVSAGDLDATLIGTVDEIAAGVPYWSGPMLAGNGDTDGDGVPELLIGCPRLSPDLTYAGGAYLVEGFPF